MYLHLGVNYCHSHINKFEHSYTECIDEIVRLLSGKDQNGGQRKVLFCACVIRIYIYIHRYYKYFKSEMSSHFCSNRADSYLYSTYLSSS